MGETKKKYAVVFPGVGYGFDRPLLKESEKIAADNGYTILEIKYEDLPADIKGDEKLMLRAIDMAFYQAKEQFLSLDLTKDTELLFISKSIGTVVSAILSFDLELKNVKNVYYTPLSYTFSHIKRKSGIAFLGTGDSWNDPVLIRKLCEEYEIPLKLFEFANHSLLTDDEKVNAKILERTMEITRDYIEGNKEE